ncbi:hypothetical protein A1O3_03793 [Capronia epimyces CBS 606.96]|uniref:Uncharacterized protein n=1 Tax=Capronia epimyces CBS 606.96 TaxID=1182542 RepID=W9YX44_9EURO|nr:uncharacterized protein A1O3_03793 [Capronia epimyces CBS 606.96]EXJ86839.1 hypothetical protein A1O3_03793 [Capronia epimyces CBS 606.96]
MLGIILKIVVLLAFLSVMIALSSHPALMAACSVPGGPKTLQLAGISCHDLPKYTNTSATPIGPILEANIETVKLKEPAIELLPWANQFRSMEIGLLDVAQDIRHSKIKDKEAASRAGVEYARNAKKLGRSLYRLYYNITVHMEAISMNLDSLAYQVEERGTRTGALAVWLGYDIVKDMTTYLDEVVPQIEMLIREGDDSEKHFVRLDTSWNLLDGYRQQGILQLQHNLTSRPFYHVLPFWSRERARQKKDLLLLENMQEVHHKPAQEIIWQIRAILYSTLNTLEIARQISREGKKDWPYLDMSSAVGDLSHCAEHLRENSRAMVTEANEENERSLRQAWLAYSNRRKGA